MKILINIVLLAAGCSAAMAAAPENQATGQLASFTAKAAPAAAAVPAPEAVKAPANWAEAAKAAFERELDSGGLTTYADLLELPPGARSRLEKELQTLPQGPGNSSEAFKMLVNGRTAFVVQSYIHSDSMRVYIFNAAGVAVAYGEGSVDKDFAWLPLP